MQEAAACRRQPERGPVATVVGMVARDTAISTTPRPMTASSYPLTRTSVSCSLRLRTARPSLVPLRRRTRRRPSDQTTWLLTQLPADADDLEAGAIVVIEEVRVRVRALLVDNTGQDT